MAFDFEALMASPAMQMGLGMLGSNQGYSGQEALGNALRGGLVGFNNAMRQKQVLARQRLEDRMIEEDLRDRAVRRDRAEQMREASMGLLGGMGLSPQEEAYYGAQTDPYASYMSSRPAAPEPIKVGGALLDPTTYEPLYEPPQKEPLVQIQQQGAGMKPSEVYNAAMKMVDQGYVDTLDEGVQMISQGTLMPGAAPVPEGVAAEVKGTMAPPAKKPRTMGQQTRQIRRNLLKMNESTGRTGMDRANDSYDQNMGLINNIDRVLDNIDDVWTGKLGGSRLGQWIQAATSPEASDVFNAINAIATTEKVEMIGAAGSQAFNSEKEGTQMMSGLTQPDLSKDVIKKRLKRLRQLAQKSINNYKSLRQNATEKAGIEWLSDPSSWGMSEKPAETADAGGEEIIDFADWKR